MQVRFALGPYLLNPEGDDEDDNKKNRDQTDTERQPLLSNLQPAQTTPAYSGAQTDGNGNEEEDSTKAKVKETAKIIGYGVQDFRTCTSRLHVY